MDRETSEDLLRCDIEHLDRTLYRLMLASIAMMAAGLLAAAAVTCNYCPDWWIFLLMIPLECIITVAVCAWAGVQIGRCGPTFAGKKKRTAAGLDQAEVRVPDDLGDDAFWASVRNGRKH